MTAQSQASTEVTADTSSIALDKRAKDVSSLKMAVQPNIQIVKSLLLEEIERIIAEAKKADVVVRAGYLAGELLRAYPTTGLSFGRVVEEILAVAAASRVPVEMGPPE